MIPLPRHQPKLFQTHGSGVEDGQAHLQWWSDGRTSNDNCPMKNKTGGEQTFHNLPSINAYS